mmetsp:Transcript_2917/g.2410  ORF Transcript_2917/g.2410 Transcript_2917/m.2410 type:complete len:92 (+) Transcript_2917:291-566(+)
MGYQSIYDAEIQGTINTNFMLISGQASGKNSFICYTNNSHKVEGMIKILGWNKIGCKFTSGVLASYSVNKLATTYGIIDTQTPANNYMKLG